MNKKKSKALAFLLAASLLVPSTNGIVSAAELNASTDKVVEDVAVVEEPSLESDKVVESDKAGKNWGADYETATTFTINSLEELKAFRDLVNNGKNFKGKTVNLNSSIDLTLEEWTPIGNGNRKGFFIERNSFKGIFNGNGNTISNLKITSGEEDSLIGFFGGLSGATVKNINFENVDISSASENVGTLAGVAIGNSTISGINVKSGKLSASNVGGVIGRLMIEGTIESCTNTANITASSGGGAVAGIVSKAYYTQKNKEMNIINCTNTGTITGDFVGGIVGLSSANISGCTNSASISGKDSTGGIIGEQKFYGTISSNNNSGSVSGNECTGGIVGWIRYLKSEEGLYPRREIITVNSNKNSGNIIATSGGLASAGGIVGNIYNAGYVYDNENTADQIEGTVFAAGVVGALQPSDENSFADKKDIKVYDNLSTTLEANIVGKNKDPYVYNNDTKGEYTKVENNMSKAVATVNGKNYGTLELAIKAAMSGEDKTVKLLSDIKVDTWNQIWNIKGITLDGNGKTIKVKKIESLENHDAVLHSAGGNTFKNLTIDLSEVEPGKAQGIRAISASTGDVIDNVTIIGGKNASYGITVGSSCKNLTVKNSNISNCGSGIYFDYGTYDKETKILIKGNTFDGCEYASILYPTGVTFENNTVKGGKLNIMNDSTVVQKNTFTTDSNNDPSRVKFYTEGNNKTFKYNKLTEGPNGEIGSTVTFATASDTGKYAVDPGDVDLSLNYLGDKDKFDKIIEGASKEVIGGIKDQAFDKASDVDNYLNEGSNIPSKPIKPTYDHTSIIGSDRYETAGKIADKLGSYNTAVLVNATSTMSDGLSAAGLAGKEDAAILLVKKDSIPKATMDRLSKVKKVYIIGGENAISQKVVNQLKKNNVKVNVERLGGKTRVETSELVAKEIGNYKKAFVVNGFKGEADAMSASSVAAREEAPILLTNGKSSSTDRQSGVSYYVVGGKSVMNDSIVKKYKAERIAGDDRYETNREVINEFYGASETLYFANGETLVDALTASTIAKDDGLVLVGRKSDNKILNKKNTIQVGGMKFDVDFEK